MKKIKVNMKKSKPKKMEKIDKEDSVVKKNRRTLFDIEEVGKAIKNQRNKSEK